MAENKITAASIEDAFTKINEIINNMSNDDITLEESLELYDKGVLLLKYCDDEIDKAEKKIIEIREKSNADE